MPQWLPNASDLVKVLLGFVLGILAKPLEQMTIGRWQKGRARKELYKRMAIVFFITRLTLQSVKDAQEKELLVEPQLNHIDKINLSDHDRFIERDKNLLLGDQDFIAYCNAIEIARRAAKEEGQEKLKSCLGIEETFLKATRLGYIDIDLMAQFGEDAAIDGIRGLTDEALVAYEEVKRKLKTKPVSDE